MERERGRGRRRRQRERERNLIEVLYARHPFLFGDPNFLRRALVVEGVASFNSPRRLESFFDGYGVVEATVLLQEADSGERVGMLVFAAEEDCLFAETMDGKFPGAYGTIHKIDNLILQNPVQALEVAVEEQSRRCSTAEAFRRMVPRRYLEADAEEDLHLRCLLMRTGPGNTEPLSHLYGVTRTVLRAAGSVCALVAYRSRSMAMVVFDDASGIERCGSRSLELIACNLSLYDSGLFPLPDVAAATADGETRDLLPPFCLSPRFLGRVVVLRGPDMAHCDAGDVCKCIEEDHRVVALMVHRAEQLAVVVLRSGDDARDLMGQLDEFWTRACGRQPISTALLGSTARPFSPRPGLFDRVVEQVAEEYIRRKMTVCPEDDLARRLVQRESLRRVPSPSSRRGNFAERAFVLTGLAHGTTSMFLWLFFSQFGDVEATILFEQSNVALIVFDTPAGVARMASDPGIIGNCRSAPSDDEVAQYLLVLRYTLLTTTLDELLKLGDDGDEDEVAVPLPHEDAMPLIVANYVLIPSDTSIEM